MRAARDGRAAIDMLAFIGSEGAANAIMGYHSTPITLHKVLGLGSKNAAVLLPGTDYERAAQKIVKGALRFNGQRCTAEKIIFVKRGEGEHFVQLLSERIDALKVGMPWQEGVAITPLPETVSRSRSSDLTNRPRGSPSRSSPSEYKWSGASP